MSQPLCHLVFALCVVFDTLTFCIPQLTTVNYILHVNETDSIFHPTLLFITPVKLYYMSRTQRSFWSVASNYAFTVYQYQSNFWEELFLSVYWELNVILNIVWRRAKIFVSLFYIMVRYEFIYKKIGPHEAIHYKPLLTKWNLYKIIQFYFTRFYKYLLG